MNKHLKTGIPGITDEEIQKLIDNAAQMIITYCNFKDFDEIPDALKNTWDALSFELGQVQANTQTNPTGGEISGLKSISMGDTTLSFAEGATTETYNQAAARIF